MYYIVIEGGCLQGVWADNEDNKKFALPDMDAENVGDEGLSISNSSSPLTLMTKEYKKIYKRRLGERKGE